MGEKMSLEDMERRLNGFPRPQGWQVGEKAYGFAGGYFGRDSYNDKVCIATGFYDGVKWALFAEENAPSFVSTFEVISGEDLDYIERYKTPEKEYE